MSELRPVVGVPHACATRRGGHGGVRESANVVYRFKINAPAYQLLHPHPGRARCHQTEPVAHLTRSRGSAVVDLG